MDIAEKFISSMGLGSPPEPEQPKAPSEVITKKLAAFEILKRVRVSYYLSIYGVVALFLVVGFSLVSLWASSVVVLVGCIPYFYIINKSRGEIARLNNQYLKNERY